MTQYMHKRTGKIITVDDSVRMISVWEKLVMPPLRIPDAEAVSKAAASQSIESAPEMQTFETVVELKKSADKAFPAQTARGSVYEYTDGQWVKVSG